MTYLPLATQLQKLGMETSFRVSYAAADWAAKGNRVYPFHLGDIDISPPQAIVEGISRAIAMGKNGYCPGPGIPLLREQLARVLGEERNISYQADNVAVQPGGKPVIGKFLMAVMNPGDEVLYPVPGFPIYGSQISYQNGIPVPYYYAYDEENSRFKLDVEAIRSLITDKTKAIIFNNYHNPTGATASQEELDAIAELVCERNLWLLSDDAYFNIRFDNTPARTVLGYNDEMRERTIVLFTCSKQFAMTGWRVGVAVGPKHVIDSISVMNTNMESCTPHFIQQAIGEALRDDSTDKYYLLKELDSRRSATTDALNSIDGIKVHAPKSGFYVYCDMSNIMARKGFDSIERLMTESLQASGVSFCTGGHFGEDPHTSRFARFAFSGISGDAIVEGLAHLKDYYEQ